MPRIEGVSSSKAGPFVRLVYWFAKRRLGKLPEPAAVMAHHRWILQGAGAYELLLERARLVDRRLKALAGIKAAALVGCRF